MIIPREGEKQFKQLLQNSTAPHQVVLLEGARQVGKSTFLENVLRTFSGVLSFNLETDRRFRADIDRTVDFSEFEQLLIHHGLTPNAEQILFIDEAQESEVLGRYVRSIKEKWLHTKCILSGSSMTRLFRPDQRVPVGRITRMKLGPLSFYEFLVSRAKSVLIQEIDDFDGETTPSGFVHREMLIELDKYLEVGGLPEVVTYYNDEKDFQSLRRSLLLAQEDDFLRKTAFEQRHLFTDALRGVANHLGSVSKYTHIGDNPREVKSLVSVMRAWHLILEMEQKGMSSTTKFYPKRYCYDIGIAQHVRNMPFPSLSILKSAHPALRTQLGGLLENVVYLQLEQSAFAQVDISGWKDSSKNEVEVDFVWRKKLPVPIECKAALRVTPRMFKNVHKYLTLSGGKVGFLVSAAPYSSVVEGDKNLINLPLYLCFPAIIDRLLARAS